MEMTGDGPARGAPIPRGAFLGDGRARAPGVAVAAILEGTRPLLVEVQALVAPAGIGPPRRTVAGLDVNRLALLIAVLARRGGVDVSSRDVYASLTGGVDRRASRPWTCRWPSRSPPPSATGRSPAGTLACGEVSLLGELRPVRGLERRLREAARLASGGPSCPQPTRRRRGGRSSGLELVSASRRLREALELALRAGPGTSG